MYDPAESALKSLLPLCGAKQHIVIIFDFSVVTVVAGLNKKNARGPSSSSLSSTEDQDHGVEDCTKFPSRHRGEELSGDLGQRGVNFNCD